MSLVIFIERFHWFRVYIIPCYHVYVPTAPIQGFFDCPIGLKQGCLLSPVLFSVFINKLSDKMSESGING